MSSGIRKFKLLLWKNYLLQKRHPFQTIAELIIPHLFTIILLCLRHVVDSKRVNNNTYFPEFNAIDPRGTAALGGEYILYAPNIYPLPRVMEAIELKLAYIGLNYTFKGYPNEEELLQDYKTNPSFLPRIDLVAANPRLNVNPVLAAVVFEAKPSKDIKYKLRFPIPQKTPAPIVGLSPTWLTQSLYPIFQLPQPRHARKLAEDKPRSEDEYLNLISKDNGGPPGYWREGFLFLQALVDLSIAQIAAKDANATNKYEIVLSRFPFPPYIEDKFILVLQEQLGIFLVLSFLYPTINIAKSVAQEKERRLKESMKMMGLPNWLHWTAWFVKDYSFLFISSIIMTIMYKVRWFGNGLSILTFADSTLLCFLLACFCFSTVTFGFLISSLFSTGHSAATATSVLYFLNYFPYFFVHPRYQFLTRAEKIGTSFLSNSALCYGARIITMFEGTGAGIQWSTIGQGASPDDNMTLLDVIIMLLLDGFLHLVLAIYVESILPGDIGIALPWYYPFTTWYWCNKPRQGSNMISPEIPEHQEKNELFMSEPPNSKAGIQIKGLTKAFGKKVAVQDLHLNFYENQVTALLGHNGAGKTTTMSMLTGLYPPTLGTAIVNGFDIRDNIKSVRESLGLCPQYDVLFDELTVEEHLYFFCTLKGHDKAYVKMETDRMLKALNLENKRNSQSHTLSGGMKRRLSVGIALVGGSKVVLLDEPTSGQDPAARRGTWDLIAQEKKGRTIVLSTHYLDEADLLGDRIAIMAEGQVRCCGSSLFLKKKFGGGYHLIFVKLENCNVDNITQLLRNYIPDVEIDQNIGAELSYSLPDEKSDVFPQIFDELEKRKNSLGIESYGCSITQMEEVFMRVGKQVEEELYGKPAKLQEQTQYHSAPKKEANANKTTTPSTHPKDSTNSSEKSLGVNDVSVRSVLGLQSDPMPHIADIPEDRENEGIILCVQQFRAMIVKKALYTWRNKAVVIGQMAAPVIFLVLALLQLKTLPDLSSLVERAIDLSQYNVRGKPVTTVDCPSGLSICKFYRENARKYSDVKDTNNFEKYIVDESKRSLAGVTYHNIVGLKVSEKENGLKLKGYFNNQPWHAVPLALNFITTAIIRDVNDDSGFSLSVSNHPLPLSSFEEANNLVNTQQTGFTVGFYVAFGMAFVSASFVVFVIKERASSSKHLQFLSGVKYPIFWLAHLTFDGINYLFACCAVLIVLVAFQTKHFSELEMLKNVFIILFLYGWEMLPLVYLASFIFSVPSSGFIRIAFLNFFTGLACLLSVAILRLPALEMNELARYLDRVFMIFFPNYTLGNCLQLISLNKHLHELCPDVNSKLPVTLNQYCDSLTKDAWAKFPCCSEYPKDTYAWQYPGIGAHTFFLLIKGILYSITVLIIESKVLQSVVYKCVGKRIEPDNFPKDDPNALEDSDVMNENIRIRGTDIKELCQKDTMVLKDLTKFYGNFLAVDRLCLGVLPGECFGLLGNNGAGKSTSIKMLTGDIPISFGDAFIASMSVKENIKKAQRLLGYCPQCDAIIPELTGRQTLILFARLRGIKECLIKDLVETLGSTLLFSEHLEKPCGTYSGGNKRKLSVAIALTGDPPIVFLDEPTTGMDPVARRHLWNAINGVREKGTSVVLTSHSMEECEALCTRLAIMVNGKFRCCGSSQHLKNKFAEGYTLIAQIVQEQNDNLISRSAVEMGRRKSSGTERLMQWERDLLPLRDFIEDKFKGCTLKDIHPGYVYYHITDPKVTWAEVFSTMEEAKTKFKIEAYSVGQTTLEQLFLSFIKAQV